MDIINIIHPFNHPFIIYIFFSFSFFSRETRTTAHVRSPERCVVITLCPLSAGMTYQVQKATRIVHLHNETGMAAGHKKLRSGQPRADSTICAEEY